MRPTLALLFVAGALSRSSAQCPPAIAKLSSEQKYDEARAEAKKLVDNNSNDDAALECVGRIYEAQGKSGDAVDWYEKSLKINDRSPLHHLYLAEALGDESAKGEHAPAAISRASHQE